MTETRLRLDKWLWYARFYKTRTLASAACGSTRIRVNGTPVDKPSFGLACGDVLTLPLGRTIRIVRVLALGTRRGPASEARLLYDDLTPPPARIADDPAPAVHAERPAGAGRPSKSERRATDRLSGRD